MMCSSILVGPTKCQNRVEGNNHRLPVAQTMPEGVVLTVEVILFKSQSIVFRKDHKTYVAQIVEVVQLVV
jgi:hypothetical protein